MCACVCAYEHTSVHTWRSEEYLQELVLSSYHVGSGAEVQPSGLGQAHSPAESLCTLPSQTALHVYGLILRASPFLSPCISHYSGKFDFMNE